MTNVTRLFCVLVIAKVLLAAGDWSGASSVAGETPNIELLNEVADRYQENRERIRSWSGTAVVKHEEARPGKPHYKGIRTVDFLYDAVRARRRWVWRKDEAPSTEKSADRTDTALAPKDPSQSGIVKDGAFYRATGLTQSNERAVAVHVLPAERGAGGVTSRAFDPAFFLTNYGQDLAQRFRFLHDMAAKGDAPGLTVTQQGSHVTAELNVGGLLNRYVADLAQGGNPIGLGGTMMEGEKGLVMTETTMVEYEQVDHVWVPHRYSFHQTNNNQGVIVNLEIAWIANAVNKGVKDDDFELTALGVQPTNLVEDLRSHTIYAAGFPAASTPQISADAPKLPVARVLLIVNVIVVVLVLAAMYWKRTAARD